MSQQLQQPSSQQTQPQQSSTGQQGQYPQPSYQAQSQVGQQFQQMTGGRAGGQFEQQLPQEALKAVQDLDRLANVTEWAKTKVAERGMTRAVRICDDIEDLAHLEKKLIIRQSPFAQPIGQAVVQTIQQNLQELQAHSSEPAIQEMVQQVQQSLSTVQQGASRIQQTSQMQGQQGGMQSQQGQTQGQPYQQSSGSQQFY